MRAITIENTQDEIIKQQINKYTYKERHTKKDKKTHHRYTIKGPQSHLEFSRDNSEGSGVKVGSWQNFIKLSFLLLQCVSQGRQLLLQQQILEAALLLYLMNCLDKLAVQVIPLFLGLKR